MSTITPVFTPGIIRPIVSPIDDAENLISTVFVIQWNVIDRVSFFKSSQWKVQAQGISSQKASNFNVYIRKHVTGSIIKYGIDHAIVWPIDANTFIPAYSFNISRRLQAKAPSSWRVIQRRSSSKKISFDAAISLYAHSTATFNVLFKVRKPGFILGSWFNRIDQPLVHPIAMADLQTLPYIEFNIAKRIKSQQMIRFNDRTKIFSRMKIAFNDKAIHVVCQKTVSWETLMRL